MNVPILSKRQYVWTDRGEATGHFFKAAGEAPRLLAFDEDVGCPLHHSLAVLAWTMAVGVLKESDLVHAAKPGGDASAAVVERRSGNQRSFVYLGPTLDAPLADAREATLLLDEPGLRAYEFSSRAHALAHFLRATQGSGSVLSFLSRRAPEVLHVHRWLSAVYQEPSPEASNLMLAGWFATTGGGVLFAPSSIGDPWVYEEVGAEA